MNVALVICQTKCTISSWGCPLVIVVLGCIGFASPVVTPSIPNGMSSIRGNIGSTGSEVTLSANTQIGSGSNEVTAPIFGMA